MTPVYLKWLIFAVCMVALPPFSVGFIRKVKARMQNRIGAPVWQPVYDWIKFFRKGQTVSDNTTWVFQVSTALNTAVIILIALFVPWLSFKPAFGGDDLFLLLYLLALMRFMQLLSAQDQGSAFGGFGASREAYLSLLVEPALFLCLAALALIARSTSLSVIFDFSHRCTIYEAPVWLSVAFGIYLASVVDLSRMPIDDPSTHLELTMVHEAMMLENSGKNLGLSEFGHFLRMVVLYGLTTQCLLHLLSMEVLIGGMMNAVLSVIGIFVVAFLTAMIESIFVKLQWRRTPEFVAYALTMGLLAVASALIGGVYARHTL
jgi:formate hydrogenlyase subunit 4